MSPELQIPVLFLAGLIAGGLNVVAGGGSFLSLPALIWAGGLTETMANGTNRIGILLANLAGTVAFWRKGLLRFSDLSWSGVPATAGGTLGALLAVRIGDENFRLILVFLMVVVSLYTLLKAEKKDPDGKAATPDEEVSLSGPQRRRLAAAFFFVGIYAGFVQAGTGFFALAVTTAAGISLVRGNAVKVSMNLCLTLAALGIFISNGAVDYQLGLIHGVGAFVGGQLGARLTILKGNLWVKRVVTATIILFSVALLVQQYAS